MFDQQLIFDSETIIIYQRTRFEFERPKISIRKEAEIKAHGNRKLEKQTSYSWGRAWVEVEERVNMADRWLPNNEEFFFGLVRLLETSENNLNTASYDNSEFLFRRLDAYERTLSTLLNRMEETHSEAQNLIFDLHTLLGRTSSFRSHYQRRFFLSFERERNGFSSLGSGLHREDNGGPGRPKLHITREQLHTLNIDAGFSWSEISRMLGISERTLRRRRHELGMAVEGKEFSSLSDNELDDIIRQVLSTTPGAGLRMVQGAIKQRGLIVQRDRILYSLRRVDPVTTSLRNARRIVRRTYNVPSPNALW